MFSGKTEELIRRLKRAKFARQRVEIFKPAIDTRYSEEEVVSHDSNSIATTQCVPVEYSIHIHYSNRIYTGSTSTAATNRPGISTIKRFTREPRIESKRPS